MLTYTPDTAARPPEAPPAARRLLPVELEIEIFCHGLRLDQSISSGDFTLHRTRAGLGSGIELRIPATPRPIRMNAPVAEAFAGASPLSLRAESGTTYVYDGRSGEAYRVTIAPEPFWYLRKTASGRQMSRIGVLQGNYLGIYIGSRCQYWKDSLACKFCTTGKNVGFAEEGRKSVEDVVEVATAAQRESGSIFTHLNTGYQLEDRPAAEALHGLRQCLPYVRALRERVGGFIGVQAMPVLRHDFRLYEELAEAGVDHFSFCYEFEDREVFEMLCPGKAKTHGQEAFFEAMEYTARLLGPGRVSGEIIAGLEPVESTKRGIDRIVSAGAFPTVCIFRPTIGSELEAVPPPDPESMREVFAYAYEACMRAGLAVGILPIEVSLVVQPEEARALVAPTWRSRIYELKRTILRQLARPYVAWKLRPAAR
jgi:solute carrier family 13 (sodium-dependent dicarboxylate transporter), member 2/3/5